MSRRKKDQPPVVEVQVIEETPAGTVLENGENPAAAPANVAVHENTADGPAENPESNPAPEITVKEKEGGGRLIAHRGAVPVSRETLRDLPTPEPKGNWRPIAHYDLVSMFTKAFADRGIGIAREQLAVMKDGAKIFGVFDLELKDEDGTLCAAFGFRTANDKSMSIQAVAGNRVFVCDNLAFSGEEYLIGVKHYKSVDLEANIQNGLDMFQLKYGRLSQTVKAMKALKLNEQEAKMLLYNAFLQEKLVAMEYFKDVHTAYFEPPYDWGQPSLWTLSNAFTYALREQGWATRMNVLNGLGLFFRRLTLAA